jgi:hypothetical protein
MFLILNDWRINKKGREQIPPGRQGLPYTKCNPATKKKIFRGFHVDTQRAFFPGIFSVIFGSIRSIKLISKWVSAVNPAILKRKKNKSQVRTEVTWYPAGLAGRAELI